MNKYVILTNYECISYKQIKVIYFKTQLQNTTLTLKLSIQESVDILCTVILLYDKTQIFKYYKT